MKERRTRNVLPFFLFVFFFFSCSLLFFLFFLLLISFFGALSCSLLSLFSFYFFKLLPLLERVISSHPLLLDLNEMLWWPQCDLPMIVLCLRTRWEEWNQRRTRWEEREDGMREGRIEGRRSERECTRKRRSKSVTKP